ncbi:MAG: TetR/AcrR family transcriptional regulator [Dehalococcoidia bacterium]|nr:TetR/AcrR family transcriptional regulator [Dehalococcoidia bacterium]
MPTEHLDSDMRRHQIVQNARKIVVTQGMTAFTIQELAKDVGLSEGAIYRHFKSKDDILLALIHDIERNLMDAVSESAQPNDSALDHLEHLLRRHFSSIERRDGVSFVVIGESLRFADHQVNQATRQMVERYLGMVEGILRSGAEKGEIDEDVDTEAAAVMFFGMIQASVTLWSFSNRAHPLTQHSTSLWSMFINGLTSHNHKRASSPPSEIHPT